MLTCISDYGVKFSHSAQLECDELWIAGGAYGNIFAIKKLNEMANGAKVVYNGDLHWFDANLNAFNEVEALANSAIKLNGNVEMELKRAENFGCGCNYPEYEDEIVAKNAELIHARLKGIGADFCVFDDRATTLFASVGGLRVAITHGDERSLNGWGFDHQNFKNISRQDEIKRWFEVSKFDILATSHTCKALVFGFGDKALINNGSLGMPNFSEFIAGLATRISTKPHEKALYRKRVKGMFVELVMIRYDRSGFLKYFENIWSDESPASISYKARILGYGCPLSYKDINFGGFDEV
ncbi:calcineurin phosphoesterase [Campylobacter mucosalis]|uniref:Uncharacterized protein n=1 Tax=Campylobacter mucosalis CCUG 21559 TaxID=1032067 RepID=A0A6G5QER6_9BACT|nr:calcineurin phosphoesterase [Campylobacter mucosalis]QCD44057.1 hypothetical protein CMUC_0242 [Campylobacter mucosalis CCUG 21559]